MNEIPEGTYKARAVKGSAQLSETSSGNELLAIDLHIASLARSVRTYLVFTEKSQPFCIDRLKSCGWDGVDITQLNGIDANEVDVEVSYEDYQGKRKLRAQIRGSGALKPLDASKREEFKRRIAAQSGGDTASEGSDIPF